MLTSQNFPRKIRLIIGPELFHEPNAMGLNLLRLKDFRDVVVPSGMFVFDYVAFTRSRIYGNQDAMVARLKDSGILVNPVLVEYKGRCIEKLRQFLQELLFLADGYAQNGCLKALGISRHRCEFPFGRNAFVKSLVLQAETAAAWDWNTFTLLWKTVRS